MRAQRFPLELPFKYRAVGTESWIDGTTENISHTGVLFRADRVLEVDTPIEIDITLPVGMSAAGASELLCQGRIVRAETRASERPRILAAVFSDYRFVRAQGH